MTGNPFVVLGAKGMLGRAWMAFLRSRSLPVVGLSRADLDITDSLAVERSLDGPLRAVINTAAFTDVDRAEAAEDLASTVNGAAVGDLVCRCDELGIPMVHYSTDYVFDGFATTPYGVDVPPNPINAYGRSKAIGEQHVRRSPGPHLLIRTSWMYAPWGTNFVMKLARLAVDQPELRVVDDERGRPSSAQNLVQCSFALLESGARGIFHITDDGECSWFELASFIAGELSHGWRVHPCKARQFGRTAPRPGYSVLDLSRTESRLGSMKHWRQSVASALRPLST